MRRRNRAQAVRHRPHDVRRYRSGVRPLEDRLALSVTPGSDAIDGPPQLDAAAAVDAATSATVGASTAGLDSSFDADGVRLEQSLVGSNDVGRDVARQADGKYLLLMTIQRGGPSNLIGTSALARYNVDGTLDASFGTAGTVQFAERVQAMGMEIAADGKILVGGLFDRFLYAARLNVDGTADVSFGTAGVGLIDAGVTGFGSTEIARTALQADGKLVVTGRNGTNSAVLVARFGSDGSADATFNGTGLLAFQIPGASGLPREVVVQADGKIVVAGSLFLPTAYGKFFAARLLADGTLDTSYGTSGDGITDFAVGADTYNANRAVLQSDGKLLIVGQSNGGFDFAVARLTADGLADTTFGGTGVVLTDLGGSDAANAVTVQADGKIVVGGVRAGASTLDFAIARYRADGTLDTSFDGDGKRTIDLSSSRDVIFGLWSDPDGRIVFSGTSEGDADGGDAVIGRLAADGALDPSFNGGGTNRIGFGRNSLRATATVALPDGRILVAGEATNSLTSGRTVVWRLTADGALDTTFGDGGYWMEGPPTVANAVRGMAVGADGMIYLLEQFGGRLTRLTADGMKDTSFAAPPLGFSVGTASDLAVRSDGRVIVVGTRSQNISVARFTTTGALDASFDGDGWTTIDIAGGTETGTSVALDAAGRIVVGGSVNFSTAFDFVVARFHDDGSLDSTFSGDGTLVQSLAAFGTDTVRDILIDPDGKIVVGGDSILQFGLMRLLDDGTLDPSFSGDGIAGHAAPPFGSNVLSAIVRQADGKYVAAGYESADDGERIVLVRYLADGSTDVSLDGEDGVLTTSIGPTTNRTAAAVLQADGKLIVVGHVDQGPRYEAAVLRFQMGTPTAPPSVAGVYARGSGWNAAFVDYLDSHGLGHDSVPGLGYRITAALQSQSLPWSNVDQITLQFNGPVTVGLGDLTLVGSADADPPPAATGFAWNAANFTATWTFDAPLAMNKYLLHLDGAVLETGSPFDFRFDLLPGDADASAGVTFGEIGQMRNMLGTTTATAGYNPRQDWDGSGSVTFGDVGQARLRLGTSLGSLADPIAPAAILASQSTESWSFAHGDAVTESTSTVVVEFIAPSSDVGMESATVTIAAETDRPSTAVGDLLRPGTVQRFATESFRRLERRFDLASGPAPVATWSADAYRDVPAGACERSPAPVPAWRRLRRTEIAATVANDDSAEV